MTKVRTRSKVAADGTVPVGTADAGVEVEVTVRPVRVKKAKDMTREEWVAFVTPTAGSIPDATPERSPPGDYSHPLTTDGQPNTVSVAARSGSKVDLPDDEWLAAFARTAGSIQDPSFRRPEQPAIDPAPEFD